MMNVTRVIEIEVYVATLALLSFLVAPARSQGGEDADDSVGKIVRSNLLQICHTACDVEHPDLPKNLADITNYAPDLKPEVFVCPGTGSKPGPMSEIADWTDFIFVGNAAPDPGTALVISPPENHDGQYGYVAFAGCDVRRLPAEQVRDLVKDPVGMMTWARGRTVAEQRERISVQVPRRLKQYFPPGTVYPSDPFISSLIQVWNLLDATESARKTDFFPATLATLGPAANSNLFVCPGTGSRAGLMSQVEQWTDYIYVGNMPTGLRNGALLISPPENHGGEFGWVLFVNGVISRIPAAQMRAVIVNPLKMVPRDFEWDIRPSTNRMTIRVPRKFQQEYVPKATNPAH